MLLIKKFISYYKPHKKLFAVDMICSFLVAVCDLFYPTIAKNIINAYVPNKELRLMMEPVLFSSKKEKGSFCRCRKISWRMSPCMRTPTI